MHAEDRRNVADMTPNTASDPPCSFVAWHKQGYGGASPGIPGELRVPLSTFPFCMRAPTLSEVRPTEKRKHADDILVRLLSV